MRNKHMSFSSCVCVLIGKLWLACANWFCSTAENGYFSTLQCWKTTLCAYLAICKVTKKFFKWKQAHVGMEPSKTSQTRREQHHNTFTSSLHLVPFCQLYALCLLVVCRAGLWKEVGRVLLGVYHMLKCMENVYVVGGSSVVAIEHGRYSLSCMQKLWAMLGLHGMLGVLSEI